MGHGKPFSLHFEDGGDWCVVPEWAEYFTELGRRLVDADTAEERLVVALALPTRAYAAAFVGLGAVIRDIAKRDLKSGEAEHFEMLAALPTGTCVLLHRKKKAQKGVICGVQQMYGQMYLGIQLTSGDQKEWIPQETALQVQPVANGTWKLSKMQKVVPIRAADFVGTLLNGKNPSRLNPRAGLVCSIVGHVRSLKHEVCDTNLALHVNESHFAEGRLQDVLRIGKFASSHEDLRAGLVPLGRKTPSAEIVNGVNTAVIYDGATGFLKWGSFWRRQHHVVILDRTEAYFQDAVAAVNDRFSKSGLQEGTALPGLHMPPGSEVLAFRERTS